MIGVLIISDIRLYRDGLAQVLGRDDRIDVVGARGSRDAEAELFERSPDVVLLDTANAAAIQAIPDIARRFPGARVVALGVAQQDGDVIACAEAGVAGYVFRDASLDELLATIESAARGELRCSPAVAATLLRRIANLASAQPAVPPNLTRREQEIVDPVADGLSNKQIAARLFIEVPTVKNHIHSILEKLRVRTRAEAAAKFHGHITLRDPETRASAK
jgi:DNA-binding NarL/FixJ family response regulator